MSRRCVRAADEKRLIFGRFVFLVDFSWFFFVVVGFSFSSHFRVEPFSGLRGNDDCGYARRAATELCDPIGYNIVAHVGHMT